MISPVYLGSGLPSTSIKVPSPAATSTLPAAWTVGSANGNQLGGSRLQSEMHAEHSRRTQAACSPAGHLILLPPVNLPPKTKSDAPLSEHRFRLFYRPRFVTV